MTKPERCRRKFLRNFPGGFYGEKYIDWERSYKWDAHRAWTAQLGRSGFAALLAELNYAEAALRAVRIESRTNLLFSFEKMALRDAVKSAPGAQAFAQGLFDFLHGPGPASERFDAWCAVIAGLPRRQTRVLTWPLATVCGFIAQPKTHIFLKPNVTRAAASAYGYEFEYRSKPSWDVYAGFLDFAATVRRDIADLRPRDQIDVQSFLWVQGSEEY